MNESIIEKIRSRGYWSVVIRPLKFEKERLKTLDECASLVEKCVVHFRGWPYPYVRASDIKSGIDWVQSQVHWQHYIEDWKMFQSGQFAHLFACEEDWWGESDLTSKHEKDFKPLSALDFLMTLYSFTEIYEFAARLAEKKLFDESLSITVELCGMRNRRLISVNPSRWMPDNFVCAIDHLPRTVTVAVQDVLGKARELALDHAIWVFERFNWRSPPRDILGQDQGNLIQRT